MGYTKVFPSLITSTVWREPSDTRVVWITMLALTDRDGIVECSVPGLADLARVSIEACEAALARFQEPDGYSRTQDFDGRRIEQVDGGFRVLNHAKYRDRLSRDDRRAYNARKQREYRARKKGRGDSGNALPIPVTNEQDPHITDADTDTDTEASVYIPPARARESDDDTPIGVVWSELWAQRYGEPCELPGAAVARLERLVDRHTREEVIARMIVCLREGGWWAENRHPVHAFASQFGRWAPVPHEAPALEAELLRALTPAARGWLRGAEIVDDGDEVRIRSWSADKLEDSLALLRSAIGRPVVLEQLDESQPSQHCETCGGAGIIKVTALTALAGAVDTTERCPTCHGIAP